jgi:hypothetical protein
MRQQGFLEYFLRRPPEMNPEELERLRPVRQTELKRKYIYRWDRQGRKGQPCNVLARGTMNSCLVEFADGYQMVTSRNAIKRFW